MRILLTAFLLAPLLSASPQDDALDRALARAGTSRERMGFRPRSWWVRYPRDVPHRLNHFDGLFAEPLATVPFTRTMANAARGTLAPDKVEAALERGSGSLYRFVQSLGVEHRFGGFRPYAANLTAEKTPLDAAILALYRDARRPTRFVTFGTESPYPLIEKDLKEQAARLPADVSAVLGRLVLDLREAHHWASLAFRNVKLEDRMEAARRLDLARESVDGLEYSPAVDDVAKSWDEASLWYAGLKCVDALDRARRDLRGLPLDKARSFDWETPLGWIRVRGTGADSIDADDSFLVVDLGGDDRYDGAVGASSATRLLGLCLDLAGNDTYTGKRVTQGAGLCGIGILLDAAGDDTYEAKEFAQGAGQFGLGALLDLAGNDAFRAGYTAQGCGLFGIGILGDAAGNDRYSILADGQGFGGVGGVGVLTDMSGDDQYVAEPDGPKSGRPSYHSEGKIAVSNAQGCAMGRRGDGSDGHSWAGGLGALIDIEGDDRYTAGNWSMGTGYWFGTGILYDGKGNDSYSAHVWTQGSGAHFCIGVLLDEGGNDHHVGERAGLAFGHDFTHAILVNLGGDDRYECKGDGLGFSINRSYAMLIDVGGDDSYTGAPKNTPGHARYDKRFADMTAASTYWVDSSSLALLLDVGGKDTYWCELAKDGAAWGDAAESDNWRVRNVGVGMDVADGKIDWRAIPHGGRR